MKLLNAPWRLETPEQDLFLVVDSKNMIVAELDCSEPDDLPGTVEDEKIKAEAIARLPDLLEAIGAMDEANNREDAKAWEEASLRLLTAYALIPKPSPTPLSGAQ